MKKINLSPWLFVSCMALLLASCNGGGVSNTGTTTPTPPTPSNSRVSALSIPANFGLRSDSFDSSEQNQPNGQAYLFEHWQTKEQQQDFPTTKVVNQVVGQGVQVPVFAYNMSLRSMAPNSCFNANLQVSKENTTSSVTSQSMASTIEQFAKANLGTGAPNGLIDNALASTALKASIASDSALTVASNSRTFQFNTSVELGYSNFSIDPNFNPSGLSNERLGMLCGSSLASRATGSFTTYIEIAATSSNSSQSTSLNLDSNLSLGAVLAGYSSLVKASNSEVAFQLNALTVGGTASDVAAIQSAVYEAAGSQCMSGNQVACSEWAEDITAEISKASSDAVLSAQAGNTQYLNIAGASLLAKPIGDVLAHAGAYANAIDPYLAVASAINQLGGLDLQLTLLGAKAAAMISNIVGSSGVGQQLGNSSMLKTLSQGYAAASDYLEGKITDCKNTQSNEACSMPKSLTSLFQELSYINPSQVNQASIPYLVANYTALQLNGVYLQPFGKFQYSGVVTPLPPRSSDPLNYFYYQCVDSYNRYSNGAVTADVIAGCIAKNSPTADGVWIASGGSPVAVQPLIINYKGEPGLLMFNLSPFLNNQDQSLVKSGVGYVFPSIARLNAFVNQSTVTGQPFSAGVVSDGSVTLPGYSIVNPLIASAYYQSSLTVKAYPNGYPLAVSNSHCDFTTNTTCNVNLTVADNVLMAAGANVYLQYSPIWPSYTFPN